MKPLIGAFALCLLVAALASGQVLRSRATKTDSFDLGPGGTVSITGAPMGSITILGTTSNTVDITADVSVQASSEADLKALLDATGFAADNGTGRLSINTIGNHNKFGQKKLPKSFSKLALSMPFSVDYTIKVPRYTNLEINGGKGDLTVRDVEGGLRVNFVETNAKIDVIGGDTYLTLGKGTADVRFGVKGWRGRPADIQLASGDLTIELPTSASADIDASILRTGSIVNNLPDLKERDRRVKFTDRSVAAKAGVGGALLKFTVGDGKITLNRLDKPLAA